jgi:tetratricopeptide (TPR) repeat protein
MPIRFPLLLFLFLLSSFLSAQTRKIDSTKILLRNAKTEKEKAFHLKDLSIYYKKISMLDSAIYYGELGVEISKKAGFKTELGDIYGNLGLAYNDRGEKPKALNLYLESLKIAESLKDTRRIADNHVRIGSLFDEQGDEDKALKNYFTALHAYEELKLKDRISMAFGNIGNVYYSRRKFEKALSFYLKALALDKELDNKENMKYSLGYIAMVYTSLAKKNVTKSDSFYQAARNFYGDALKLSEEMKDSRLVVNWLGNLGLVYTETKNYSLAENVLQRAIKLADSLGLPEESMQFNQVISEMYYVKGDFKKSIDHYKNYTKEKDSLFNAEKNREITKHEMTYEFDKKMATVKSEQEKKEAVAHAKSKQQKLIIAIVIGGLIIMFVALLVILKALRTTRLQKTIIERQKHLVDEKQKEIIDSINYARRIQHSLLTTETYIHKNIKRMKDKEQ